MELDSGMHLETAGEPIRLSSEATDHWEPDDASVMDDVADYFNARDLDGLLELCTDDCEVPGLSGDRDDLGGAVADLWDRRPTIHLTRSVHDRRAVGVVWEYEERWEAIGTLHLAARGERLTLLEFSDDAALLDQLDALPPDEDLPEGATWTEWADNPDV